MSGASVGALDESGLTLGQSEYVNNSTSKGKLKFESLLSEFEKICVREDITFTQAPKDGSK